MMRHLFIFLLVVALVPTLLTCQAVVSHEYIYPVASVELAHKQYLYLIHQTDPNHLNLLCWNPRTKETEKALAPCFMPAGLQMLPNGKGFSFIDNDTLRVKLLHKRSPQLIDFEEPLYNLTVISWVDEVTFYFSACNNTHFGIYQGSLLGYCDCLIASNDTDFLYPQKIDTTLFCIERDSDFSYKIISCPYPDLAHKAYDPLGYSHEYSTTEYARKKHAMIIKDIVLDAGKKPIAFLHMVNGSEGFFLEHPSVIQKNDLTVTFAYHYVWRKNTQWRDTTLFTFSIPTSFLFRNGEVSLYESILPLLPRFVPNYGFLFVDCSKSVDQTVLDIWFYDTHRQERVVYAKADEKHSFFGVFAQDSVIHYGGTLRHEDKEALPRMWIQSGILCVDLPTSA